MITASLSSLTSFFFPLDYVDFLSFLTSASRRTLQFINILSARRSHSFFISHSDSLTLLQ
jgi:hypothetical protein